MPTGRSHIPQAEERTVLQKMSLTRGIRPEQLPAGKLMIATIVAKRWIEKQAAQPGKLNFDHHAPGLREAALAAKAATPRH